MGQDLIVQEKYQISDEWNYLVEDCKAIIIQRIKNSRMEVILAYAEIGNRIVEDSLYNKFGKGNQKFLFSLCKEIGISGSSGYFALQFYERFIKKYMLDPGDVYNALYTSMQENFLEEGDNISWYKICNKYLPEPEEKFREQNWLKVYDIWNFAGIDYNFGIEYPGNIPAGIVLNTLYYYTKENDLVVDPMAGGGVTIDCCKYYDRRCLAYDIQPIREDVSKNDILSGYPQETQNCDLIFLDPPYFKKKEKEYGEISISALDRESYLEVFDTIAKESFKTIRNGGYLAFLMEPYIDYQDSSGSIWLYDYIKKFLENNWLIERIYDVPQTSQRYQAFDITRAKENKIVLTLRRGLIIFKKRK